MQAFVVDAPGDPSALNAKTVPDPEPKAGWVVIDIAAFGLNRAEAVTRTGGSGAGVPFPRIIGIECVGTVVHSGGTDLSPGQRVAAAMGGLGRQFDGSYAERTVAPRSNVFPLETELDWPTLAATPETFLTAWGCLSATGSLSGTPRVLMRPGASGLGLAAGDQTVADDLALLSDGGMLCIAGSLAESYATDSSAGVAAAFQRQDVTFYSSETLDAGADTATLQHIVDRVESGAYLPGIAEVIGFDQVPDAHRKMEANAYAGKVVVDLSR